MVNANSYYRHTNANTRSKYGAVKTTVNGIMFASKAEARRYRELKLLEKAGDIRALKTHPEFTLCPWMTDHSEIVIIGKYVADFAYKARIKMGRDQDEWEDVVEDVKGHATPLYKWKKKHCEAQYDVTIREIRY